MRNYTIEELEDLANKFLDSGAEPSSMGAMDDNQVICAFLDFIKEDTKQRKKDGKS